MIKFYTKLIQQLAKRYIAKHQPIVVGVTGSAGKSSAVAAIGTVLRQLLPNSVVYVPSRQLNGELGLPLTIFQIEYFGPTLQYLITTLVHVIRRYISQTKPYDIIVLEYGVDHVGEMDMLIGIAKPDYTVVTTIDQVHFGDPKITWQEKSKLLTDTTKYIYMPQDVADHWCTNHTLSSGSRMITFDVHNKQSDIDLIDYEFILDNPEQIGLMGRVLIDNDMIEVIANGIEYYYTIYASVGYHIARMMGCDPIQRLPVFIHLPPGRATLLSGVYDSIIVDSSYNNSPIGMTHMLDIVQRMREQFPEYRLICLIGEMRELYDATESAHQLLAQQLIDLRSDYIGLIGESARHYMYDILSDHYGGDCCVYIDNSRSLGYWVYSLLEQDHQKTIIFVKGSQNTIYLEEAIKPLLADQEDSMLLCRQSDWWMIKKEQWFEQCTYSLI